MRVLLLKQIVLTPAGDHDRLFRTNVLGLGSRREDRYGAFQETRLRVC
jgi:hypothetical protein